MYSQQIRKNAINDYSKGKSVDGICNNYRISRTCLYNWIKLYSVKKDSASRTEFTYSQLVSLKKRLDKLSRQYEILQKAYAHLNPTITQKLEIADTLKDSYFTKEMCRVIGVHHATFYNHDRRRVKTTQYQMRDVLLKDMILQIYNDSGERFGANKILQKLRSNGVNTSLSKVSSLVKELNIKSKRRNCPIKAENTSPEHFYYRNKLKQKFNQEKPNAFWAGDVTCVNIKKNKVYLCVVMDLFARKIIAHSLSYRNDNALTIDTFNKAFESRKCPKELAFHSDQGANYTSTEYITLLKSLNVDQSFSKRGTPYDNAVIESFFSNMKRDDLNTRRFDSLEELGFAVASYVNHYNSYRPHASLAFKTPDQTEYEYFQRLAETEKGA